MRHRDFLFLCFALIALFGVYWGGLFRGLYIDDNSLIFGSAEVRWGNPLLYWLRGQPHTKAWPLTHTLFWLLFRAFGFRLWAYRALSVVLHWLAGALVYVVLRKRSVSEASAAFAAVLFWLHPVAVESVTWISQLSTLLTACFLAAWITLVGSRGELAALLAMFVTKGFAYLLPLATARRWAGAKRAWLLLACGGAAFYFLYLAAVGTYQAPSEQFFARGYAQSGAPSDTLFGVLRRRIEICGRSSSHYLVRLVTFNDTPMSELRSTDSLPSSTGFFLLGLGLFALLALALWRNFFLLGVGILVYLPISGFFYVPFLKFQLVSDHLVYPCLLIFACAAGQGLDRVSRPALRNAFWAWPVLLAIFTVSKVNAKSLELPIVAPAPLEVRK